MNGPRRAPDRRSFGLGVALGAVVAAVVVFSLWPRGKEQEPSLVATPPPPVQQLPLDPFALDAVERISTVGLQELLAAGSAVVIDVRDVDSFKKGHIPGALQIPLQYIQGEVPWFPRDKKLITYCA